MSKRKYDKAKSEDEFFDKQDKILDFMLQYSENVYSIEKERESSILQQASNMQAAFSFVTAGIFIVAQITFDYQSQSGIPTWYLILVFSSITFFVLLSLFFATLTQSRWKRKNFQTIAEMRKIIDENENMRNHEVTRKQFVINSYEKYHNDFIRLTNRRSLFLRLSNYSFYTSLSLAIIWFVITTIIF